MPQPRASRPAPLPSARQGDLRDKPDPAGRRDEALDLQREAFARSVVRGLSDEPRWLSCRYLYDEAGSDIFERITEQPEYYPTRTEAGILEEHAVAIRELVGATTLVELGAGSATKTRHLLRAWTAAEPSPRYVAIDISREMLASACGALEREFPSLGVRGVAGSYEQGLPLLRDLSPLTLLFLGSSVGNLNAAELDEFFTLVAAHLSGGDHFLLGIDLVKDAATLEAAYNDEAGWSAAFTLNMFARMNRELGTNLEIDGLEHIATWNAELSRIEIFARFTRDMTVDLPRWGRSFRIGAGERVLVEISRKFRCETMLETASRHGFDGVETFTDPQRDFALLLLRRRDGVGADELRDRLGRELEAQRRRTLELISPLSEAQLRGQHCDLLSPIAWDLGHIASFEKQWTARVLGTDDVEPLYDPLRHPRSVRGTLPLPNGEGCVATLASCRRETDRLLAATDFSDEHELLGSGYLFSMIAQHEAQHSETMLQSIQLLPDLRYEIPRRCQPALDAPRPGLAEEETLIPAGPFVMGTDDRSVAYDNERPAHVRELPSFWLDVAPVTNGQYLRFVEDGAYRRPELWSGAGRRWLTESGCRHPAQWRLGGDGLWREEAFGQLQPLRPEQTLAHVCWFEADAYARWAGKRLPTEAEWEKAAAWDLERCVPRRYPWGDAAPTHAHANLDQRSFAPSAAGAYPDGVSYFGCRQMLGDVWEWTASDFEPYPGFEAFPYPEYSQVHFGRGYKVLRGGSWATASVAIRNTFRNWDFPQRRQLFSGFRCARD